MEQLFEVLGTVMQEYLSLCDDFHGEMTPDDEDLMIRKAIRNVMFHDCEIVPTETYEEWVDLVARARESESREKPSVEIEFRPPYGDPSGVTWETRGDVEVVLYDYRRGDDCERCGKFFSKDDLLGFQVSVPGWGVVGASLCEDCGLHVAEFLNAKYEKKKGEQHVYTENAS